MKYCFTILSFVFLFLASCSKKSTPAKTPPAPAAKVVIDGHGRVLTPFDQLPKNEGINANYASLARSFTPDQLKNLQYRYKTIPPKVLYVPKEYVHSSAKGEYCIYKNKFWYWKKPDGLFHLDATYYN